MVKDWPEAGTNWRGSSQMRQWRGGLVKGAPYWVPHVVQMRRVGEVVRGILGSSRR